MSRTHPRRRVMRTSCPGDRTRPRTSWRSAPAPSPAAPRCCWTGSRPSRRPRSSACARAPRCRCRRRSATPRPPPCRNRVSVSRSCRGRVFVLPPWTFGAFLAQKKMIKTNYIVPTLFFSTFNITPKQLLVLRTKWMGTLEIYLQIYSL